MAAPSQIKFQNQDKNQEQKLNEISKNDKSAEFLYGTRFGKIILEAMLFTKIPKLLGAFLRSPASKFYVKRFIRKNNIDMSDFQGVDFKTFNDFFTRKKEITFDSAPTHFISPADSFLSVYEITENATFHIKGFDYTLEDFFGMNEKSWAKTDEAKKTKVKNMIQKFKGGKCLVFRLCATDYHRYCYVDDGFHAENNFIEGSLYSVQPVALENYRVFMKNRRSWTLLETKNFGDIAQIEIGAFSVGGICNQHENHIFTKAEEKGHFDLHGSTIVLLTEKGKIKLLPEIEESIGKAAERKVRIGQQIGIVAE